MIDFHDFIMLYLIFILIIFMWALIWSVNIFKYYYYIFFVLCFGSFFEKYIAYMWYAKSEIMHELKMIWLNNNLFTVRIKEMWSLLHNSFRIFIKSYLSLLLNIPKSQVKIPVTFCEYKKNNRFIIYYENYP